MAAIRAYTTIEQSRKLAEILPLESADMCWQQIYDENHMMSDYRAELIPYRLYSGIGVPCWSLAALLDILPEEIKLCKSDGGKYFIEGVLYGNPIDACVAMIERLHELKML